MKASSRATPAKVWRPEQTVRLGHGRTALPDPNICMPGLSGSLGSRGRHRPGSCESGRVRPRLLAPIEVLDDRVRMLVVEVPEAPTTRIDALARIEPAFLPIRLAKPMEAAGIEPGRSRRLVSILLTGASGEIVLDADRL